MVRSNKGESVEVRRRRRGSEKRKSEGSDVDAKDVGKGVPKESSGRAEVAEVISGLFGGAGEERKHRSDGNSVASVWVRGERSKGVEEKCERIVREWRSQSTKEFQILS